MSRLPIAFVLVLIATATSAQEATSGQTRAPTVANATRPFLFDGRMRGDGARRGASGDVHHTNAGAIVVQPDAEQPGRER